MANLTDKQEKFVQGLLRGLSQREAYKQAYNTSKMKDNVIDVKANELLKNGKVSVRYRELHGKVIEQSEKEAIADATEIMKYWTKLMRGEETDETIMVDPRIGVVREEQRVDNKTRLSASKELAKRFGLDKPAAEINDNKIQIEMVDADED